MWVPLVVVAVSLSGAPKAAPSSKTQLKIEVQPDSAVLYVDGKRKSAGGKKLTLTLQPGRHHIKVVNRGDQHEEDVAIKKGEVKTYTWAFEDDRRDRHVAAAEAETKDETAPAAEAPTPKAADDDAEPSLSDVDQNEAALKGAFTAPAKKK